MLGITRPYLSNGKRAFYSIISYIRFQISFAAHNSLIYISLKHRMKVVYSNECYSSNQIHAFKSHLRRMTA